MTETKTQNGLHIMEVVNGQLIQNTYQGYSKKEARKMFKELIRDAKAKGHN